MTDRQDNEIARIPFDGHVYRWERDDPSWPGKTAYIAIREGEVVLGDQYADEAFSCKAGCHPADFLAGCFHPSITDVFGADVLEEVIAEVRRTLPEPASEPVPMQAAVADRSPTRLSPQSPSVDRPALTASVKPGMVQVAITECEVVDMTLATALRAITRVPIKQLLAQFGDLPWIVATDIPTTEGTAIKQRLIPLGVTVDIRGPA